MTGILFAGLVLIAVVIYLAFKHSAADPGRTVYMRWLLWGASGGLL